MTRRIWVRAVCEAARGKGDVWGGVPVVTGPQSYVSEVSRWLWALNLHPRAVSVFFPLSHTM